MDRVGSVNLASNRGTASEGSGPRRFFSVRYCLSFSLFIALFLVLGCSSTELIESPKTGYAPEIGEPKTPEIVWTSRTLTQAFDYLGQIKVRAWTYDGAIDRLLDGGKQLRADAIVDIHYDRIGFFNTMTAFAIKYR